MIDFGECLRKVAHSRQRRLDTRHGSVGSGANLIRYLLALFALAMRVEVILSGIDLGLENADCLIEASEHARRSIDVELQLLAQLLVGKITFVKVLQPAHLCRIECSLCSQALLAEQREALPRGREAHFEFFHRFRPCEQFHVAMIKQAGAISMRLRPHLTLI
ncbi:hypothetical protein ABID65_005003 [Bradyrhizobium sp. S3.9.2]|uniref:hypothetical protein n=1 Tax=unclassified Bradyrhizobium TaxID=2631580 RepID=UPI00339ABEEE